LAWQRGVIPSRILELPEGLFDDTCEDRHGSGSGGTGRRHATSAEATQGTATPPWAFAQNLPQRSSSITSGQPSLQQRAHGATQSFELPASIEGSSGKAIKSDNVHVEPVLLGAATQEAPTPRWSDIVVQDAESALPRGPQRFFYDTASYTGCAKYGSQGADRRCAPVATGTPPSRFSDVNTHQSPFPRACGSLGAGTRTPCTRGARTPCAGGCFGGGLGARTPSSTGAARWLTSTTGTRAHGITLSLGA